MNHSFPFLSSRPETVLQKLDAFTPANVKIVTDFDGTVTADNGKTSWSLFAHSGLMKDGYAERRQANFNAYHPDEINSRLSEEYRRARMKEWWEKALDLLREFELHEDTLRQIVTGEMFIRGGMDTLLMGTQKHGIPVLILSAGITQTIKTVLEYNGLFFDNVSIVSNQLQFNNSGICTGFSADSVIHPVNKDESEIPVHLQPVFASRRNTILLGDSVDDIKMIPPADRESTLAIGFCTAKRQPYKTDFLATFDMVVKSDAGDNGVMEWVLDRLVK